MKQYQFTGATVLSVDQKFRLLVPAEVRRRLDDQDTDVWVIKIGNNGRLWLYPESFYVRKVYDEGTDANEGIDEIDPTPEQIDRMINRSADIQKVTTDKAGRILLPELLMTLTGLARGEVVLLGVFNHLQLWSKADYAERQKQKSIAASKAAANVTSKVAKPAADGNTNVSSESGETNT